MTASTRSLSEVEMYSKMYYKTRAREHVLDLWEEEGNSSDKIPDLASVKRLLTVVYENEEESIKSSVKASIEKEKAKRATAAAAKGEMAPECVYALAYFRPPKTLIPFYCFSDQDDWNAALLAALEAFSARTGFYATAIAAGRVGGSVKCFSVSCGGGLPADESFSKTFPRFKQVYCAPFTAYVKDQLGATLVA